MELQHNYRLISNWFRRFESWHHPVAASSSGPASFVMVIMEDEQPIKAFLLWAENEDDARTKFMEALPERNWMEHWVLEAYPFNQNEILDLDSQMFFYERPLTTL